MVIQIKPLYDLDIETCSKTHLIELFKNSLTKNISYIIRVNMRLPYLNFIS